MPIVTKAPGTSSRDLLTIAAIGGRQSADETQCETNSYFGNMTNLERGEGGGGGRKLAQRPFCAPTSQLHGTV